ncbi:hypothetical protein DEIPH_ctg004orf0181 [Deinococcus phoenicis]|uniref:Uncharacterized protein n=1 Tax=Deinococcus phoenicis TaxID=1476583 RepID=A0A016QUV7_9DEIO|nr:hypothetical protein [Deinococcus phoenicis]EYB69652.1 hypothetical protein DEIPH_ctg004orf0181 [Deinococcus phoenicis]
MNDTSGQTALILRCADRDRPELWASLTSENDLISAEQAEQGLKPALTIRLGDDPPVVLRGSDLVSVVDAREAIMTRQIGFQGPVVRRIVNGLNAGKRLVVRIHRVSGEQALTYTFPGAGFGTAWAGVNGCESFGSSSSTAPSAARVGLLAGRAHLCDLVVETVPNGARPVSAEFRYELEYRDSTGAGKLTLPGVDHWPPAGGTVTRFRQEGNRLIFTLPLNVRDRTDRVYTSLNVTGRITFSNGSSKNVYEPLPVLPPY